MSTIFDIAPPEAVLKQVIVRGTALALRGVSARDWAALYHRFPELAAAFSDDAVAESGPLRSLQMRAALVAAGLGQGGNDEIERAVIDNLARDEIRLLSETVVEISHPGDAFGPLLTVPAPPMAAGAGPADPGDTSTSSPAASLG